jgi:hypothetical protein
MERLIIFSIDEEAIRKSKERKEEMLNNLQLGEASNADEIMEDEHMEDRDTEPREETATSEEEVEPVTDNEEEELATTGIPETEDNLEELHPDLLKVF